MHRMQKQGPSTTGNRQDNNSSLYCCGRVSMVIKEPTIRAEWLHCCRMNGCAITWTRPINVTDQSTRVFSFHGVAIIKLDLSHQTNHPHRDDRICLSHGAFQLISYRRLLHFSRQGSIRAMVNCSLHSNSQAQDMVIQCKQVHIVSFRVTAANPTLRIMTVSVTQNSTLQSTHKGPTIGLWHVKSVYKGKYRSQ